VPEKTLMAFADHGELHPDDNGDAVTGTAALAQTVFDAVAAAGSTSRTCSWRSSKSPGHSGGTP